jgi:hypothetical protein
MEVITLTPEETQRWIQLVTPVQQETIDAVNKQGLNGQELVSGLKVWLTNTTSSTSKGWPDEDIHGCGTYRQSF